MAVKLCWSLHTVGLFSVRRRTTACLTQNTPTNPCGEFSSHLTNQGSLMKWEVAFVAQQSSLIYLHDLLLLCSFKLIYHWPRVNSGVYSETLMWCSGSSSTIHGRQRRHQTTSIIVSQISTFSSQHEASRHVQHTQFTFFACSLTSHVPLTADLFGWSVTQPNNPSCLLNLALIVAGCSTDAGFCCPTCTFILMSPCHPCYIHTNTSDPPFKFSINLLVLHRSIFIKSIFIGLELMVLST